MRTAGMILCGGKSSRMGHAKAWLPFGEERLLPRVVRVVAQAVKPVVVAAAPGQTIPELGSEITIARDSWSDQGPLRGLATGLSALASLADAAFVAACDLPFLEPSFIHAINGYLDADHDIAVPVVDGFPHPLAAVYRCNLLGKAEQLLGAGQFKLAALFKTCRTCYVPISELPGADADFGSLCNVNTPEDYLACLRRVEREPGP